MADTERHSPHLVIFFRHGSNLAMAIALAVMAGVLTHAPHPGALLPWVGVGLAMFPLYEYIFHRFILHLPPVRPRLLRRLQDIIHYLHHEDTSDLAHFFTPLWLGFPLVCVQGLMYLALGASPLVAVALLFGNLAGFLNYEWVHYVAHAPYTPRTRWGRYIKKYHLWHHHKNEHYWFGVTTPAVDWVFGTYKQVAQVPTSPTARRLYSAQPPNG